MGSLIDHILFYDELGSEQKDALHLAMQRDTGLATMFVEWQRLKELIRDDFDATVSDHRLLVLYAMSISGYEEDLNAEEKVALEAARPRLESAVASRPALQSIVKNIQQEQADFETIWAMHTEPVQQGDRAGEHGLNWRPVRSEYHSAWRYAAAVIALVLTATVLFFAQQEVRTVTLAATDGSLRSVELADGTRVRLMEGAVLTYERGLGDASFDRHVRLDGKALFEVVHADQPFVVETSTARTTVLGTTFGIETNAGFTEVVLAEGEVSLASIGDEKREVLLKPGQMSRVRDTGEPSKPVVVDVADALDWTRLFVFRNEPMAHVAERISAHYGVPVTVDVSLRVEGVSGTFEQNWDLEYILRTLSETLDVTVELDEQNGYHLRPRR